ncbi:MAG: nitroreductase family protein [Treponema sp.]|nr:nitroreductase family protein [Treponema sp.]
MGFLELAWKRNSVRNFKTDDIPAENIQHLLEAARAAPSGGNCQPWHFYVIRDKALKQKIHDRSCKQDFILNAPVFFIICIDPERSAARYGDRGKNLYSIQDTAAAIENLLLCAVDEGLAACWCGAFDETALSEILELKNGLRPVAVIPVGYAVSEPAKRSRRPVEEITTFIGFDDLTINGKTVSG